MAYLFFLNDEMDEAERAANRNTMRHLRQDLRDTQDPFAIPDAAFVGLYRMPKHLVQQLIADLEPHMNAAERSTAIPEHLQVLAFLSVVANGKYCYMYVYKHNF